MRTGFLSIPQLQLQLREYSLLGNNGRAEGISSCCDCTTFADANMPKDSRTRRERMREAKRRSRAAESEEARATRMARDRARQRRARDEETPEMRVARLEQARRRQRQRRKRLREEKDQEARDALCRALLEQVQQDHDDLDGCEEEHVFLEEIRGDYRETLRKTQQPDAIMLFLNQNFLKQARQQNSELAKAGIDVQEIAMLGFTSGMCIQDVQQLFESQEDVSPEQQECSSSLDQEDPGPPHIKEEEEEFWSSQEGEQFQGLDEADISSFTSTPVPVKLIKRNLSPDSFIKDKLNG